MRKSVENIKEKNTELKEQIQAFKSDPKEYAWVRGISQIDAEYESATDFIEDLEFLANWIGHLTLSHRIFIHLSSSQERAKLHTCLSAICSACFSNPDSMRVPEIGVQLQNLKALLVKYPTRAKYTESIIRNIDVIKELDAIKSHQEQSANLVDSGKQNAELLASLAKAFKEEKASIDALFEESSAEKERFDKRLQTADAQFSEVAKIAGSCEAEKETVSEILSEISAREDKLENQEIKVATIEVNLNELIKKAQEIIAEAREALDIGTAAGLSGALEAQRRKAAHKGVAIGWLAGGTLFLLGAAGVVIWLALGTEMSIPMVIARIAILSVFGTGATFCGSQFVKQKNISEDYAYKATLAKSLAGLSQKIRDDDSDNDEYKQFISKFTDALYEHPLKIKAPEAEKIKKDVLSEILEQILPLLKQG